MGEKKRRTTGRDRQERVVSVARAARMRHGAVRDIRDLLQVMSDPELSAHPVRLWFGSEDLEPREFGYVATKRDPGSKGIVIHVHPALGENFDWLRLAFPYLLGLARYGETSDCGAAVLFGAHFLGLDEEVYRQELADLSARLEEVQLDGSRRESS